MTHGFRSAGPARAALGLAGTLIAGAADAESLRDALARTYRTNPTITASRAEQRGRDAGVALARAPGRPQVSAQGSYTNFVVRSRNSFIAPDEQADATGQVTVPLYNGGGIRNAVNRAKAQVDAGRQLLRSTEANVFVDVTTAYLDVIRDLAVVELNRGQVEVLRVNTDYATRGFRAGALTRTDIAQAETRFALAEGALRNALAQLDASRESYLQVTGAPPQALEAPPPLPTLPATPEQAVDVAVASNPDVLAAREQARAAGFEVRVARADRLPRLAAVGGGSYTDYLGSLQNASGVLRNRDRQVNGAVRVTLPLYQGGAPTARVRQAQSAESTALERATETERAVIAQARASLARYRAATDVIASAERAVTAAQRAAEGMRAENRAGAREVIDTLNAEQDLLNTQVQLVTARRDAYVAGFTLLAAMGRAEAANLGLDGGPLYDPTINYRRVAGDISDWGGDPRPRPDAPRTAGATMPSALDAPPPPGTANPLLSPAEASKIPPDSAAQR